MIFTCLICPTLQVVGEQEYLDLLQIRTIIPCRPAFTFDIFTYFMSQLHLVRSISCSEHCCCSVTQSPNSATPQTTACQVFLSFTISQSLLKFKSIESVMPSNRLVFCCLLFLPSIFSSITVFSSESSLRNRWPNYQSFSFRISPSNEYSGWISFRMDWLDLLAVQGTPKNLLLHDSSEASILQHSAFFRVQLSHSYTTIGKKQSLTRWIFVGKVVSLLFNILPRFIIVFLPKSKCLLIYGCHHHLQ